VDSAANASKPKFCRRDAQNAERTSGFSRWLGRHYSRSNADFNARFNAAIFARDSVPMNCVKTDLRNETRLSHRIA